jgi:hypothetical protein
VLPAGDFGGAGGAFTSGFAPGGCNALVFPSGVTWNVDPHFGQRTRMPVFGRRFSSSSNDA